MASSVDAKLLKSTKFPVEFNQKVDMQKVNVEVMKKWIAGKISEILGNEDDVLIELCFNLIEGSRYPDIKKMQIQLTGFLDKDTAGFCKELWKLCLSAQSNAQGVPKELLEAKKLELIQEKIEAEKAAEEARRRREEEQRRDREINNIRNRERGERGRGGRGGDSWRGGRGDDRIRDYGGRGFDRGGSRYSRSPRRRDSRDRGSFRALPPRESDSYVPSGRGGRRQDERRRSSTPESTSPAPIRSDSESRSPSRRRERSTSVWRSPVRRRSRSIDRRDTTYRGRGIHGRGRSPHLRNRRRSPTPSSSISRSPRPSKRRRSTTSPSINPSPPPRSRRSWRNSVSRSRSHSRSLSRPRRNISQGKERTATTPALNSEVLVAERRTSAHRGDRDERRLTRSNSRSQTPPRRPYRNPSRSSSRGGRARKRRRSLQRYEPANKRRRNTSSVSSPIDQRNAKADTEDEGHRRSPRREIEASKRAEPNEIKEPLRRASELREKLLKEKIKKMRTSSLDSVEGKANSQ